MLWGALAQSVPDVDFIAGFWLNPAANLLAHRGFTHSLLFALLISIFLALIAERWHRLQNISLKKWMQFFTMQMLIHIFIDAFNNYGVGWFEPFSHYRISFNTIFVADPFFSIWLGIAFIVLAILNRRNPKRKFWWRFGIILSSLYLCYCIFNKVTIDREVNSIARKQHASYSDLLTTPVPLNNWLWFFAMKNDSGFNVGYRSVFDKTEKLNWSFFPRNDSLLKDVDNHESVQKLIRFSKGFYIIEKWNDTLVFNDLRFGQIAGWERNREQFVFHYFLKPGADNKFVVQRGRFAKWDWNVIKSLGRKIEGKP